MKVIWLHIVSICTTCTCCCDVWNENHLGFTKPSIWKIKCQKTCQNLTNPAKYRGCKNWIFFHIVLDYCNLIWTWIIQMATSNNCTQSVPLSNSHFLFLQIKGHFTHEPRANHEIVRAKRKCPKVVPTHLHNHVRWSWTLKCGVKSYGTGPSTKCYFNQSLFTRVLTSVYVWQSFCKFFSFDTQKLAQKKMHINWHAQSRNWHVLWLVKKKTARQLTH